MSDEISKNFMVSCWKVVVYFLNMEMWFDSFFVVVAGNRLKPQRKIHSLLTPSQNSRHWLRSQVVLFHIIALLCI